MSETPAPHSLHAFDPYPLHSSPTSPLMRAMLFRRACGVFVAPVRTFASLISPAHMPSPPVPAPPGPDEQPGPRWLDALTLAVLVTVASTYAFNSSDTGAWLVADRRSTFAALEGRHVTDEQFAAMVQREQHGAALTAVLAGASVIVLSILGAAVAHATLMTLYDNSTHSKYEPSPRFRDALSVTTHAALIPAVATPCRLLLNLWRGSICASTSVGVFLPSWLHDSFWAHLGNAIDLFGLWWAYTLAIGFALLYLRRPSGLRLLFLGIYVLAAIAQAALKTLAGAPSW
jgi:hypothetical protein